MDLQVIFDRNDRLYRCGEVITGKVVLEPESDRTFSEIWITYQWRTHGRGDRDLGQERSLNLVAKKVSLRARERKEYPFSFTPPDGPVTYHGHLMNVDWYLTAHARLSYSFHWKCEQDFLLQSGNPTGSVVLGDKEIFIQDLPARPSRAQAPSNDLLKIENDSQNPSRSGSKIGLYFLLFIALLILIGVWVLMKYFDWSFEAATGIPIFSLLLISAAAWLLYRNAYKRKIKLGDVWVKPCCVYRGSEIFCHAEFVAKREIHLRRIIATVSARERISRTQGTTVVTGMHVLGEKDYTRSFNEELTEGRWIAFNCSLPVGSNAPASFFSSHNNLEWNVTMKAEFKGWPAWSKSLPITVLP